MSGDAHDKQLIDHNDTAMREDKWKLFLLVGGGVFLSTMDSSMVNVALPSIMRSFALSLIEVQWVVLMYLLTITVTLLLWGAISDRIGKDRIYLAGLTIFAGGSLACAIMQHFAMLLFMRFIEGLGASMMMAAGPTIIRYAFPRRELGKGLGFIGIATSIGLMSGPAVSGLLIQRFSWRWVFCVTVPFALAILIFGFRLFRDTPAPDRTDQRRRTFDFRGAVLWAQLITSLVLYAHFFQELALIWKYAGMLWLVMTGILFLWTERNRASAIMPLHLFSKRFYHVGLSTAAVSFGSLFVVLVLMPFYLDYIRMMPADMIGLVMMAVPLTLFVVSPVAGVLYDRLGSRLLTTSGMLVCFLSLLALSTIGAETSLLVVCLALALLGMGQSMFLAPNSASLLSRIQDDEAGVTAGLLATSRNLGMLIGAAFAGIVFAAWFSWFSGGAEVRDYRPVQQPLFVLSLRATFLCAAGLSLIGVFMSWRRGT